MSIVRIFAALTVAVLFHSARPLAEPVVTHQTEGTNHGLLALRTLDGTLLASGEQTQVLHGGQVTMHLVFRFKDGSVDEERTIFSQRGDLRLIAYHLVQKGPSFPRPTDMTIDARSGQVVVRYANDRGESKTEAEHLDLPPDVSNGMMNTVLKNVKADALPMTVSYVATTPKPRLVKLTITTAGTESFSAAGAAYKATHYVIKIDIGGVQGLLAPLLGKEPPDSHVWILTGDVPMFVRSETTRFMGAPMWRIEPASIGWPH